MPRRNLYQHHFSVRVTKEELRELHARAAAASLSLARYLVEVGLASPCPPTVEERRERQQALFHVRKVGVNLNQLTRRLNSGTPVAADRLDDALEAVASAVRRLAGSEAA